VEGVLVWEAVAGSPAARAGLRGTNPQRRVLGDVIVSAEGEPVRRLSDLTNTIDRLGIGQSVRLGVRRGEQTVEISVPIEDIGEGR
jgi:S1-C subfamily serine protease